MEITEVKVVRDINNWWWELHLTIPDFVEQDCIFSKKETEDGIYYVGVSEDGFVRSYLQTDNHNGYGGWKFSVKLEDGTVDDLHGPWSSRPSCYLKQGFEPFIEVRINKTNASYGLTQKVAIALIKDTEFHLEIGGKYTNDDEVSLQLIPSERVM